MGAVKRTAGYLVVAAALAVSVLEARVQARAGETVPETRVRTMSGEAAKLLASGLRRSATIRSLVALLERSDVVVLVEASLDPAVGLGRTSLIGASPTARFLRTDVSARLSPDRRLEILGHELQHAVEIAGMPDARDQESLRASYLKVGWQIATSHDHETAAAREVERHVRREIF